MRRLIHPLIAAFRGYVRDAGCYALPAREFFYHPNFARSGSVGDLLRTF